MRRCLILANQTLNTDTLDQAVRERISAGPHEFYVVAPAARAQDGLEGSGAHASAPSATDRAYALAQQRLTRALDQLRILGAVVEGEVGDPDPVQAARDTVDRFPADEILVSTLPRGPSQWLRRDVPAQLRKAFHIPVTHLMAPT